MMSSKAVFAYARVERDDLWSALCSGLSPGDQREAAWHLAVVQTAEYYESEHGVDLFVEDDALRAESSSLVDDFRVASVTRDFGPLDLDLGLYPPDFEDRVHIVHESIELRVTERQRLVRAAAELAGEEHDRVIWPRRQMDRGLALCGLPGSRSRARASPERGFASSVGGGVQMRVPTSEKTEKSVKPVALAAVLEKPPFREIDATTTQRGHKPEEKFLTITSEYDGGPISSIVPIKKSKLQEVRMISATPATPAAGHSKKGISTPSLIKKSVQFHTPTTITDDFVYCGWDGTYDDAFTAAIYEIGDGASTAATATETAADCGRFAFELARTADEKDAPDDTAHKPHHLTMDDIRKEYEANEDTITTEKSTEPSYSERRSRPTGGGSSVATPSTVDAPLDGKADAEKDDVTDDHDSKADSNGYNPYDYSYDECGDTRHSYVVEYETRRIERHVFPTSSASEPCFVDHDETQGQDDALPEHEDGRHTPDGEHGDEHECSHEEAELEHGEAEQYDGDEQGDVDDGHDVEEDEHDDGDDDGQDDQYYYGDY